MKCDRRTSVWRLIWSTVAPVVWTVITCSLCWLVTLGHAFGLQISQFAGDKVPLEGRCVFTILRAWRIWRSCFPCRHRPPRPPARPGYLHLLLAPLAAHLLTALASCFHLPHRSPLLPLRRKVIPESSAALVGSRRLFGLHCQWTGKTIKGKLELI